MPAMFRLTLSFALLLGFAGCGADTPVPDYPFPDHPPLEETELAQYVGGGADSLDAEVEEEEWDDGLSDEDLMMPAQGESGSETDAESEAAE